MWLLQGSWGILRQRWRRYLTLNLLIYSGVLLGFALGALGHADGENLFGLASFSADGSQGGSLLELGGLIWLAHHWLVLAGCLMAINLTLVSFAILAGATWPPLLVPLGGWFALELACVTAIYVALQPWSLLPLLPLLLLEGQAVILGFFVGWELGARKAGWRHRIGAWREYKSVYLLIPALLLAAGLWEAWIIAALINVTVG